MKNGAKDYTGVRFTRLLAIKRLSKEESGLNKTAYTCQCDCGNVVVVRGNNLISNTTKSCGCLEKETLRKARAKDYTGLKFNRLFLIERILLHKRGVAYRCQCDCGKQTIVIASAVTSGNTKSCGCLNREKIIERNHDPQLIEKRVTNCSNVYKVLHWQTKKYIKCKGSWERNVARFLNKNKTPYDWQVPFKLSDGRTYIIDFLNKETNTYVEIKGWWRDDALNKHELFKKDYPHLKVEVWDREVMLKFNLKIRQSSKIK